MTAPRTSATITAPDATIKNPTSAAVVSSTPACAASTEGDTTFFSDSNDHQPKNPSTPAASASHHRTLTTGFCVFTAIANARASVARSPAPRASPSYVAKASARACNLTAITIRSASPNVLAWFTISFHAVSTSSCNDAISARSTTLIPVPPQHQAHHPSTPVHATTQRDRPPLIPRVRATPGNEQSPPDALSPDPTSKPLDKPDTLFPTPLSARASSSTGRAADF